MTDNNPVLYTNRNHLDAMWNIVRRYKFHGTNTQGELVHSNKQNIVKTVWDRDEDSPEQITIQSKGVSNSRIYARKNE